VIAPVTERPHAVFLSYASQDAEAAQKICEALRVSGIEVFLDQSELRGGDAWDQKIRREIHDCSLFIPVVSQHTQQRLEGYFRREWKLAIDRTHDMAEQKPFLVPVVIDSTRDQDAIVPDVFRTVQWTRLPAGETPPAFVERIRRLASLEGLTTIPSPLAMPTAARVTGRPIAQSWRWKPTLVVVSAALAAVLVYVVVDEFRISRHVTASAVTSATSAHSNAARFSPPPHSIAVLPFVNMSGDPHQEYFSDGLTEELLNSLSRINELQVAARTSSFSFQGEHPDIATVGHKLNVASVLEGSVRRSKRTIRVTAQLIDAVTGFHLWSDTYDRDQGDILQLQTDIANAVAGALKVTLLGDVAARIEVGGTHNSAAFDAYLRAARAHGAQHRGEDTQIVIAEYTEAIRLDPNYALAFAARSTARAQYATLFAKGAAIRATFDDAEADARQAIALAPSLAEGYLALAFVFAEGVHDFTQASKAYSRAQMLAPGSARVLRDYGRYAVLMGQTELGLAALRRALVLDPLNRSFHIKLGDALLFARRYDEAIAAFEATLALDPEYSLAYADRGLAYYGRGDMQSACKSCEIKSPFEQSEVCLAVSYEKLGRHADAQAVLTKLLADRGEDAAYQYAEIYAQWNDLAESLHWLDVAVRLHDSGLVLLKVDPLLDALRKEPRFQAIEQELKFPN
jgi:TolB-like protein/tetratricopeptide (TPR) repeat protein